MIVFSGKLHWNIGILVWLTFFVKDVWINPIFFLLANMLPDCDIKGSPASLFLPLYKTGIKHRGMTHTLGGLLCFTVIFCLITKNLSWTYSFATGYFLHLWFDAMTPMGIKWIWGHQHKRKKRAF